MSTRLSDTASTNSLVESSVAEGVLVKKPPMFMNM